MQLQPETFKLDLSNADLTGCNLNFIVLQNADLSNAKLNGAKLDNSSLINVTFYKTKANSITIRNAQIKECEAGLSEFRQSDFSNTSIDTTMFEYCQFDGSIFANCILQNVVFGQCSLQHTKFGMTIAQELRVEDSNLSNADLNGIAIYKGLFENTNLEWARINGGSLQDVDFIGCRLINTELMDTVMVNPHMRRSLFRNTLLVAKQLICLDEDGRELGNGIKEEYEKSYEEAHYVYLQLKNNFANIGFYDDKIWASIKEQEMERFIALKNRRWLKYLLYTFYRYYGNYGQDARLILLWGVVTVLVFGVIYYVTNTVDWGKQSADLLTAIYFSVITFLTIGYGDIVPIGIGKLLASIEGAFGTITVSAFVVVLAKNLYRE